MNTSKLEAQFSLLPNGRKVIWTGTEELQVALAHGGGHICALRVPGMPESANPFWEPPWTSLEPEDVTHSIVERDYGGAPEGRLLASILGHSLALDLYGPPSPQEAANGSVTHGRAGVLPWIWRRTGSQDLIGECEDSFAQLHFSRQIQVRGSCVVVEERLRNLCAWDRPIGWQQHVSLGPGFCGEGFWAKSNCDLGATHPQDFGIGARLVPGRKTRWPFAPLRTGGVCDYQKASDGNSVKNDFSGFRVCPTDELGHLVVGNSRFGFALFYLWPRQFFPWLGVWDETRARASKPWEKRAWVRAYEFGASPHPMGRRERLGSPFLFDIPTYLILPGTSTLWVRYILGIFSHAPANGELIVAGSSAKLVNDGPEVSQTTLPVECGSSVRSEMSHS